MALKSVWLEQLRTARKVLRAKQFNEKLWKQKKKRSLNATKQMMHTQQIYKNLVAFMQ